MSDPLFAAGQAILDAQPFSRSLGIRLDRFASGSVEFSMAVAPDHLQHQGIVHGGVIATLADTALAFAGGSVLGDIVTSEFKINYIRPAADAERLVAVANVVGSGKTQAVVRCEVFAATGSDRRICAAAQGTIRKV